MKTKLFILMALLGGAALSARADVRFGISIGVPVPVVTTPVVCSTPVVCATPVVPAPVTVVETVPPCPAAGYVWVPGYWAVYPTGRVWVAGSWCYRPARIEYRHHHDRDGYRR